ncbi:unnamed protein product, partial [Discosporangium mesarthrocarpum]
GLLFGLYFLFALFFNMVHTMGMVTLSFEILLSTNEYRVHRSFSGLQYSLVPTNTQYIDLFLVFRVWGSDPLMAVPRFTEQGSHQLATWEVWTWFAAHLCSFSQGTVSAIRVRVLGLNKFHKYIITTFVCGSKWEWTCESCRCGVGSGLQRKYFNWVCGCVQ